MMLFEPQRRFSASTEPHEFRPHFSDAMDSAAAKIHIVHDICLTRRCPDPYCSQARAKNRPLREFYAPLLSRSSFRRHTFDEFDRDPAPYGNSNTSQPQVE